MIDVLYCLEKGNRLNFDNEIILSIRSLLKFGNPNRIFIAGSISQRVLKLSDKIIHIEHRNPNGTKSFKIAHRIATVCKNTDISDDFIWFADDYILTQKVDLSKYPHYISGNLGNTKIQNAYSYFKINTHKYLTELGFTSDNFDCHTPIIYNKEKFLEIFREHHNAGKMLLVKSTYANILGVKGILTNDSKVDKSGVNSVISLSDNNHSNLLKRINLILSKE